MSISPELKNQIEDFLEDFREDAGTSPDIADRDNYDDFRIRSGISFDEMREILLKKLSSSHYLAGPEPERDPKFPQGIIYKFIYPWENYEIYIKLKIYYHLGFKIGICLSFHD